MLQSNKAYVRGNRVKAMCAICGEGIYNRMRFNSYRNEYAHTRCVRDKYGTLVEWEKV